MYMVDVVQVDNVDTISSHESLEVTSHSGQETSESLRFAWR